MITINKLEESAAPRSSTNVSHGPALLSLNIYSQLLKCIQVVPNCHTKPFLVLFIQKVHQKKARSEAGSNIVKNASKWSLKFVRGNIHPHPLWNVL